MNAQTRCAGFIAVTIITVAASLWEAASATPAGFGQEPAAPAAGSPQTQAPQPRALTLEERADIYMARKKYADAADYYYQTLKKYNFKNAKVCI